MSEAFKTIKPEELLTVTQTPCARDGFIGGILTGAAVGGVRFIMRGKYRSAETRCREPACCAADLANKHQHQFQKWPIGLLAVH